MNSIKRSFVPAADAPPPLSYSPKEMALALQARHERGHQRLLEEIAVSAKRIADSLGRLQAVGLLDDKTDV